MTGGGGGSPFVVLERQKTTFRGLGVGVLLFMPLFWLELAPRISVGALSLTCFGI